MIHLGDNPSFTKNWSLHGRIPTLRQTSWRLWIPQLQRFLLTSELYLAMGFPVYADVAGAALTGTMAIPGAHPRQLLGNAMHVACIGVVMTSTLLCIRLHRGHEEQRRLNSPWLAV